jgi:N-acetylmuramoyl-L-alanine amidase
MNSIFYLSLIGFLSWASVAWAQTPLPLSMPALKSTQDAQSLVKQHIIAEIGFKTTLDEDVYTLLASDKVSVDAFHFKDPNRIILDFAATRFQISERELDQFQKIPAQSIVQAHRFGLFSKGHSRLVIDLKSTALLFKIENIPHPKGLGYFINLHLKRKTAAEFAQKATEDAPLYQAFLLRTSAPHAFTPPPTQRIKTLPVVVIDAGHGGIDSGAVRGGIMEKDIVFAFAQSLKQKLLESQKYTVVMTRDSDVFIELNERVRIAQRAQADLFISIHADSLVARQNSTIRGATLYTRSERASDVESANLAAKENLADSSAGVIAPEDQEEISDILTDLARRETQAFSQEAAQNISGTLKMSKIPLRSAGFRVLRAPDVPSLLIELGYLTSVEDAALLRSEAWRNTGATALREAVHKYFAIRKKMP